MKISNWWTLPGYLLASYIGSKHGSWVDLFIVLAACVMIDLASWASSWKEFR